MKNILLLFAHPRFENSRVNRALLTAIRDQGYITLHDLYENYPDFNIDAEREKQLLLSHQIIVWQYPLYMYGAPAILKQWIDLVLHHGWAHGRDGNNVTGKIVLNAVTTGGTREAYAENGFNRYSLREFLTPFEQTAYLCKMLYLPPFAVQGTYLLSRQELERYGGLYLKTLRYLAQGADAVEEAGRYALLNDWIETLDSRGAL